MNQCWFLPPQPLVIVLLGRAGDCIQILPCLLEIYRRTGLTPIQVICQDYAPLLDGVSYVQPHPISGHWWKSIPQARQIAENLFGGGVVLPWWDEDPKHAAMISEGARGDFVIQCHAQHWGVDITKWPSYGVSMASRLGFTQEEWVRLPLVFDRRDPTREEQLFQRVVGRESKPIILYNFTGASSPFPFWPEVINPIRAQFGRIFKFVDLGSIRAHRIYDLLGLYDRAIGMLTSDTATLHLAPAAAPHFQYIGFTVNGWSSSVPKGNCVLHVKYSDTRQKLQEVFKQVARWQSQL